MILMGEVEAQGARKKQHLEMFYVLKNTQFIKIWLDQIKTFQGP